MNERENKTMKKFFPLVILFISFGGFLAGQMFFEVIDSRAGSFGKSKEKYGLYENLYQEVKLSNLRGEEVALKSIKSPVVILNFWASWCTPCLKEFPHLIKLREMFPKNKVQILGINSDEENQLKNIKKIVKEHKLNFDIIVDNKSQVTTKFLISEIPMSIIYHNGKVLDVAMGETDFTSPDFLSRVKAAIDEPVKQTK